MELIDKQELLDWIQNCWDWATVDGITSTTVLKQTMTDISQLPTVEAIPKEQYEARLKADMVAMLKDLRLEIEKIFDNRPLPCSHYQRTLFYGEVDDLILDKINALKENEDGSNT